MGKLSRMPAMEGMQQRFDHSCHPLRCFACRCLYPTNVLASQAVPVRMSCGPAGPHCPPRPLLAFKPTPTLNFHRPGSPAAQLKQSADRPVGAVSAPSRPTVMLPPSQTDFPFKWGVRLPRSPGGGHHKRNHASGPGELHCKVYPFIILSDASC